MKTQRPIISASSDDEHRVLQFRPRAQTHTSGSHTLGSHTPGSHTSGSPMPGQIRNLIDPIEQGGLARDLSHYERDREEPDDYRHRMLANIAAFAFTVALISIGIWLAMSIASLRRTQDCVLMGLRDCVRISSPRT
ncbi:hypothetical protein [Bradyrhizobium sp. dw_411]|uniref:hypothetical protein n=1 Tax=Bradyrhizobium sp. dw_411 TaxID=2720082 RepID=UPI001BCD50AE